MIEVYKKTVNIKISELISKIFDDIDIKTIALEEGMIVNDDTTRIKISVE